MPAKLIAIDSLILSRDIIPNNCRIEDQLVGTGFENLMEFAGRICYDSIHGLGRGTSEYFQNILDSEHYSILSHVWVGFAIEASEDFYKVLSLEPGVFLIDNKFSSRSPMASILIINLRALYRMAVLGVYQYDQIGIDWSEKTSSVSVPVRRTIEICAMIAKESIAPHVFKNFNYSFDDNKFMERLKSYIEIVRIPDYFRPFSFHITCSRSCSHELIRHNYQVAISQRSTRFCDESNSKFVIHPKQSTDKAVSMPIISNMFSQYKEIFNKEFSESKDRKTARGIAARYLPHGLETQLIMTFPYFVLENVFRYRLAPIGVDQEIYDIANEMKNQIILLEQPING